jgi:hypothetical protein
MNTSSLSQTYKLETADFLAKLLLQYNNFTKKHYENNATIVEYLTQIIVMAVLQLSKGDKDNDLIHYFDYIRDYFRKYTNTVSLYASISQHIVDHLFSGRDKQLMFKILEYIEDDKDYFMTNVTNNTSIKNKFSNPMLKQFGLLPVTYSLEMQEIIPLVLDKSITGKIDFKSIAKSENCCFIILYNVVYNAIEYNMRSLIIKRLAEKNIQPNSYGINDKIIDRFQTIKMITDAKGKHTEAKWDFSHEIHGDIESNKIYILESIDGKKYRILSPWIFSKTYSIPMFKVKALLKYLENSSAPTRVSCYHKVSIKAAVKNMFVSKQLDLESIEEHSKEIDTQSIKTELFLKINSVIKDIIRTDFANGKKIKGNTEINDIIHDDRISDIFSSTLLRLYNIGFKSIDSQEFDAGKFPFYELLSSYILDLRDTTRKFMKEFHDLYNRDPLAQEIFDKSNMTTINHRIETILTTAITNQISDKDNLYQSLNYKYLLLNFH